MGGKWTGYQCDSKFWRVRRIGLSQETWHGAIGTKGKVSVKHFESDKAVKTSIEKVVASKLRKSYVLENSSGEQPVLQNLGRGVDHLNCPSSQTQPDAASLHDGRTRALKGKLPRYYGNTKVSNAIGDGNAKRLRKLFAEGVSPDVRDSHDDFREFNYAVSLGNLECVQAFIEAGVTLNALDGDEPPIAKALWAQDNQVALVQLLLDNGAAPNGLCPKGVVDTVPEAFVGNGEPVLHCALQCPGETKRESIRRLQEAELDIAAIDNEGSTVLHVAAAQGQVLIAQLLIELGIPVDQANRNGDTAFDICKEAHMNSPLSDVVAWDKIMDLIVLARGRTLRG